VAVVIAFGLRGDSAVGRGCFWWCRDGGGVLRPGVRGESRAPAPPGEVLYSRPGDRRPLNHRLAHVSLGVISVVPLMGFIAALSMPRAPWA
jgi:hypothetical protein